MDSYLYEKFESQDHFTVEENKKAAASYIMQTGKD